MLQAASTWPSLRWRAILWTILPLSVAQQCWYPDGVTPAIDVPCVAGSMSSPCCGADAYCLDNGLCSSYGVLSRGSCTDKKWGSGCTPYCQAVNPTGGTPLQPCESTETPPLWACAIGPDVCGQTNLTFQMIGGNDIVLRADQVAPLQGSSSGHVITISPSTTLSAVDNHRTGVVTTTVTKIANPTDQAAVVSSASNAPLYTAGDMAGVGVGVGIPLLIALIAALFVIWRQRRRLNRSNARPINLAEKRMLSGSDSDIPRYTEVPTDPIHYDRSSNQYSSPTGQQQPIPQNGVSYHHGPVAPPYLPQHILEMGGAERQELDAVK